MNSKKKKMPEGAVGYQTATPEEAPQPKGFRRLKISLVSFFSGDKSADIHARRTNDQSSEEREAIQWVRDRTSNPPF